MGASIAWVSEKDFSHHLSVPFIGLPPQGAEAVVRINLGTSANSLSFLFFVGSNSVLWR